MSNCIVNDKQLILIPEGEYQLQFVKYETRVIFGPKVVLTFKIIQPQSYLGKEITRHYNVQKHHGPQKIDGRFEAGLKGDLVREFVSIFGDSVDLNSLDINDYGSKIVKGTISTVTKSSKKKDIPKLLQYSVISELSPLNQDSGTDSSEANYFDVSDQEDLTEW